MSPAPKQKFDVNGLIEQHRWWIGGVLLAAIVVSAGFLFWKNSNQHPSKAAESGDRLAKLEEQVDSQSVQIKELTEKIAGAVTAPVPVADPESTTAGSVAGASISQSKSTPQGKINLNSATQAQLDTLPGIGPAYATRIIEYRQSHGGFKDVSELKNIKGIGDKTFDKLKDLVTL